MNTIEYNNKVSEIKESLLEKMPTMPTPGQIKITIPSDVIQEHIDDCSFVSLTNFSWNNMGWKQEPEYDYDIECSEDLEYNADDIEFEIIESFKSLEKFTIDIVEEYAKLQVAYSKLHEELLNKPKSLFDYFKK